MRFLGTAIGGFVGGYLLYLLFGVKSRLDLGGLLVTMINTLIFIGGFLFSAFMAYRLTWELDKPGRFKEGPLGKSQSEQNWLDQFDLVLSMPLKAIVVQGQDGGLQEGEEVTIQGLVETDERLGVMAQCSSTKGQALVPMASLRIPGESEGAHLLKAYRDMR